MGGRVILPSSPSRLARSRREGLRRPAESVWVGLDSETRRDGGGDGTIDDRRQAEKKWRM